MDILLIETVKQHRGQDNPISENQLRQILVSHGYTYGLTNVHQRLRKLMFEKGLAIGFVNAKGYYWITNEEEIKSVISDLRSRMSKLQAYIDHLNEMVDVRH
jgi:hypothetical protein